MRSYLANRHPGNNVPGFGQSGVRVRPKINQPSVGLLPANPQPTAASVQFFAAIHLCRLSDNTYQLERQKREEGTENIDTPKAPGGAALTGNTGDGQVVTTCFSRPVTLQFDYGGTDYEYRFTLNADPTSPTLVGPVQLMPTEAVEDPVASLEIGSCLDLTGVRAVVTACLLG